MAQENIVYFMPVKQMQPSTFYQIKLHHSCFCGITSVIEFTSTLTNRCSNKLGILVISLKILNTIRSTIISCSM